MKNQDLMLKTSSKNVKLLENKVKREGKPTSKKWKPYKHMTYEEKKRLGDKEALKDHLKHVSLYFN
jgi:hypothetical protein